MNPKNALPDVKKLIQSLSETIAPHVTPATCLVGIHTGGAWLAEHLHAQLGIQTPLGGMDISFYRDDFGKRGLHPQTRRSHLPFNVDGAHIVIVDDVLYTGRTIRAALNELFDYGRPDRVELAVLVDRLGRELPIAATYCAYRFEAPLPAQERLRLEQDAQGQLELRRIYA